MTWEPCSDCEKRVDQRRLEVPTQEHIVGLDVLEVLKDIKDAPLPGNWMRVTHYACERCGLLWIRTEGASGSLCRYESTLSPHLLQGPRPAL